MEGAILSVDGSTAADGTSVTARFGEQQHRERRRLYGSLVRILTVTPAVFAVYALAPLDGTPGIDGALLFLAAMATFAGLVGYQVLAVIRSPFPWIRAIEGATMCVPLLIVMFSTTYFLLGRVDPQSFSEPMTRLDAVYFTTTVFATVGFGDLVATSQVARAAVCAQMAMDLVVVGLFARVLLKAAERRRGSIRAVQTD